MFDRISSETVWTRVFFFGRFLKSHEFNFFNRYRIILGIYFHWFFFSVSNVIHFYYYMYFFLPFAYFGSILLLLLFVWSKSLGDWLLTFLFWPEGLNAVPVLVNTTWAVSPKLSAVFLIPLGTDLTWGWISVFYMVDIYSLSILTRRVAKTFMNLNWKSGLFSSASPLWAIISIFLSQALWWYQNSAL